MYGREHPRMRRVNSTAPGHTLCQRAACGDGGRRRAQHGASAGRVCATPPPSRLRSAMLGARRSAPVSACSRDTHPREMYLACISLYHGWWCTRSTRTVHSRKIAGDHYPEVLTDGRGSWMVHWTELALHCPGGRGNKRSQTNEQTLFRTGTSRTQWLLARAACDNSDRGWRTDRAAGERDTIWLSDVPGRPRARLPSSPGRREGVARCTQWARHTTTLPASLFTPSLLLYSSTHSQFINHWWYFQYILMIFWREIMLTDSSLCVSLYHTERYRGHANLTPNMW